MTTVDKVQDRQKLANLITQWNQDHYDLFELSLPNEVRMGLLFVRLFVLFVLKSSKNNSLSLNFKVNYR